ncbi:Plasmodium vivax Vir protein, putative [Plasmodium ovale]|uniref:Plasmodium vivax Vir protein, putative n=1 Tax=Plasmodium ovale TaxID=36330 RepID=A0A1C3KGL7_PLAOA|nr:Plasmodium vivax Vir protein, putative [Plasmodium ovale]
MELFLNVFNSHKFYDKLNTQIDSGVYSSYCNSINNNYSEYVGVYDLCRIFERNLRNLDKILEEVRDSNDLCTYFNFWIHDELRKKLRVHIVNEKRTLLVREFFKIWSKIKRESLKHNCEYNYNHHISLDLWKKWKDLYDYIKNYDSIKNIITSNSDLCRNYESYYTYIAEIYGKYKEECCKDNTQHCPFYFRSTNWCKDSFFLTKFTCDVTEAILPRHQARVESPVHVQEFGNGDLQTKVMSKGNSYADDPGDTKVNNSNYNDILSIVFPFLGLMIIFFIVYKFTALGTWIRKNIIRKKNNNYIQREDIHELLENKSDTPGINAHDNFFLISYNST